MARPIPLEDPVMIATLSVRGELVDDIIFRVELELGVLRDARVSLVKILFEKDLWYFF